MDVPRALEQLERFLEELDRNKNLWNTGQRDAQRSSDDELRARLWGVQAIADAAQRPGAARMHELPHGWSWRSVRDEVVHLRGWLTDQDELQEILGPSGPTLAATGLHPWVWTAAASLYDEGHRREAVETAALVVDEHLNAKVERPDLAGKELVEQAFSRDDPGDLGKAVAGVGYIHVLNMWRTARGRRQHSQAPVRRLPHRVALVDVCQVRKGRPGQRRLDELDVPFL